MAKVDDEGPHWATMRDRWLRADSLLGGTEAMREAGQTLLPRFPLETTAQWALRRDATMLTNFYKRIAHSMVGNIFRSEITFTDCTLPEELLDDIDRQQTDVQGMAERMAFSLLTKAVSVVLVDHPKAPVEEVTVAQAQQLGLRHYWNFIKPNTIVAYYSMWKEGVEYPVYLSWREPKLEKIGNYEYVISDVIRVQRREMDEGGNLGRVIWETHEAGAGGTYKQTDEGALDYPVIPVSIMYAERQGAMTALPPLDDLAFKNIEHWQSSSDQRNILRYARFPLTIRTGLIRGGLTGDDGNKDDTMPTGPGIIIDVPEGVTLDIKEHSGAAIEAGERDLARILAEAEIMALDLTITANGQVQTATKETYDRIDTLSPLQRIAKEVERGSAKLLEFTADWRGSGESGGYFEIPQDTALSTADVIRVQALKDARAQGDLDTETYLSELKLIGALSSEVDVDAMSVQAKEKQTQGAADFNTLMTTGFGKAAPPRPQLVK